MFRDINIIRKRMNTKPRLASLLPTFGLRPHKPSWLQYFVLETKCIYNDLVYDMFVAGMVKNDRVYLALHTDIHLVKNHYDLRET